MTERCTGCGSVESLEEIKTKHPQAISCCPERKLMTAMACDDGGWCFLPKCREHGCMFLFGEQRKTDA